MKVLPPLVCPSAEMSPFFSCNRHYRTCDLWERHVTPTIPNRVIQVKRFRICEQSFSQHTMARNRIAVDFSHEEVSTYQTSACYASNNHSPVQVMLDMHEQLNAHIFLYLAAQESHNIPAHLQEGSELVIDIQLIAVRPPGHHCTRSRTNFIRCVDEQVQLGHMHAPSKVCISVRYVYLLCMACGSYIHPGKPACTNPRSTKASACSR